MIACVDVAYRAVDATVACVLIDAWESEHSAQEIVVRCAAAAPYEPGSFYKRELPCILELLGSLPLLPDVVVIDGYVWLSADLTPGLGGHLYRELGSAGAVVGVAKTRYRGAPSIPVTRGGSRAPLHVTAAGMDTSDAAVRVAGMHGPFRIPASLKRADALSRAGRP